MQNRTGGTYFIHSQPQTLQGEPVDKSRTFLLIMQRLSCKLDIKEVLCNWIVQYTESNLSSIMHITISIMIIGFCFPFCSINYHDDKFLHLIYKCWKKIENIIALYLSSPELNVAGRRNSYSLTEDKNNGNACSKYYKSLQHQVVSRQFIELVCLEYPCLCLEVLQYYGVMYQNLQEHTFRCFFFCG